MRIGQVPRYGSTNSFVIMSGRSVVLVDTGLPPTLPALKSSLSEMGVPLGSVTHVFITHFHPDHIGCVPALMSYGIRLVLFGEQEGHVHDADPIYAKDPRSGFRPIDDDQTAVVPIGGSRQFLADLGVDGEVMPLPSHSPDSIGIMLDSGDAIVGDLIPLPCVIVGDGSPEATDWEHVLSLSPRIAHYGHAPSMRL